MTSLDSMAQALVKRFNKLFHQNLEVLFTEFKSKLRFWKAKYSSSLEANLTRYTPRSSDSKKVDHTTKNPFEEAYDESMNPFEEDSDENNPFKEDFNCDKNFNPFS
ncbi:hypothetical protein JTB14_012205 [Gonioctena quinquepunctata]|nr:hypothetical protein JTB14_012205 [Gonioctena quinquepunctata]